MQNSTFSVVVYAHRNGNVFDRCDDDQSPDYERQCSQGRRGIWIFAGKQQDGLESVKRACPDVAEDNAQRGESSYRKDGLDRGAAAFSPNRCHAKLLRPRQLCGPCSNSLSFEFVTITTAEKM